MSQYVFHIQTSIQNVYDQKYPRCAHTRIESCTFIELEVKLIFSFCTYSIFQMADSQNDELVDEGPIIGIDLGTTTSCVAVFDQGSVKILENDFGETTTPSYVAFIGSERIVGKNAKRNMTKDPKNTIFAAKRLIGLTFGDEVVQKDVKNLPFDVINVQGKPKIQVQFQGETKQYFPEEISSMVLTSMKETAEKKLKRKITKAVITVPAYFGESQRQSTQNAGKIAGLQVMQIIKEPIAAAIAYGLQENLVDTNKTGRNVLVYDLGKHWLNEYLLMNLKP